MVRLAWAPLQQEKELHSKIQMYKKCKSIPASECARVRQKEMNEHPNESKH